MRQRCIFLHFADGNSAVKNGKMRNNLPGDDVILNEKVLLLDDQRYSNDFIEHVYGGLPPPVFCIGASYCPLGFT